MIRKAKLGQSILGFAFAFIILAAMSVGLTRIWAWYNINFGSRQVRYQESRRAAASPGSYGAVGNETAYLTSAYNPNYKPVNLTEQWVFKGQPTESTPFEMPDFPSLEDAENHCKTECPGCVSCVTDPETGTDICSVDVNCECFVRCMCREKVAPQIAMYNAQMAALQSAATSMRNEANNLRHEAERCDDPWELCWWGGFGLPSKKLREAASSLDRQAARICCGNGSQYGMIRTIRDAVLACCNDAENDTAEEQDLCLEHINATQCPNIINGYITDWQENIDTLNCAIGLANNIISGIDNRYPRVGGSGDGCRVWANYQCLYQGCEPAAIPTCETEIQNNCLTDCQTYCTDHCTCYPPACDPAELDPACYANCVNNECIDDGDGHIDTNYEVCVDYRMHLVDTADPDYNLSYNACIERETADCNAGCPGTAIWNQYYEECCQSFCCYEDPMPLPCSSNCGFGIFDRDYHGYSTRCRLWPMGGGCRAGTCQCCDETQDPDDGTWVYPGRIGDGCIRTWQVRYPEWADYNTWCAPGFNDSSRWWDRGCMEPDTNCDDDCEEAPMPAGCITGCCDPEGRDFLAMCGLEEFRARQPGYIAGYTAEREKYIDKQNYIRGCCNNVRVAPGCTLPPPAGCIDWVVNPATTPSGPCLVRNELGVWEPQITELTEFGCMAICIDMANRLGEEEMPEGGSLEELCPECYPAVPLPPDELETCVRECTGTTSDCCVQWCVDPAHTPDPENYGSCITACYGNPAAYGCPAIP